MKTEEESFLQREARRAEIIADYLQLVTSLLLLVTFSIGIAVIAKIGFNLALGYTPAALLSLMSTVLMISLVGTVADQFRKPSRKLRVSSVLVTALIGSFIGVLEDWVAPTSLSESSNITISIAFAIIIVALIISLAVVQSMEDEKL